MVSVSYLEIYNEAIRDLLSSDPKAKLDLKEHPDKGVYPLLVLLIITFTAQICERFV